MLVTLKYLGERWRIPSFSIQAQELGTVTGSFRYTWRLTQFA
jgi:hypothetical protein